MPHYRTPILAALVLAGGLGAFLLAGHGAPVKDALTSRPRPKAPAVQPLAGDAAVRTGAGERRRLGLADGSVLFVNENTSVAVKAGREVTLAQGEVYVEAGGAGGIEVQARDMAIRGQDASFAVRIDKAGADIAVTRGAVAVGGIKERLRAGQRLAAGAVAPSAAPRTAQALAWIRDLVCAAEAPLLPPNDHAGGALVAVDPQGQEAKLALRRFDIDVHIEDGFARTTIDQVYFNDRPEQLEGTFYFPLPPDASLSRLAMYVNGQLMEGGMAERDRAREVYETIRYARRDPALLEWVDGSTFKMRVFPLEPRQEKRIVLSYSQRLPARFGQLAYRFPAGHTLQKVREWTFHARIKDGAGWPWACASHKLRAQPDQRDLELFGAAQDAATNRDVALSFTDPRVSDVAEEVVQFSTAAHEGARYLMARVRPRLGGKIASRRRDWVFLVETSGDRDPLLARVQIETLRHLLSYAEPDDTFAVLAAGTRVRALHPEPLPATAANIATAAAFLEQAHLIGALDLGQALTEAASLLKKGTAPHLVHLGSGIAAMGERRADVLAKRIPDGAKYIGIGVGRRWARGLMKTAAERTGGYFTQINPDEPVAWRAFELLATVNTPRLMDVQVVDRDGKAAFLAFSEAVADGEEIAAVTRVEGDAALPAAVIVKGTLEGKPFARELAVKNARPNAGYLPRTWAKLEIDRLLAADAAKHKEQIVALSKAMYVITPYTSLLVLENEDQYTQYNVDRGRKDHWALYPLPEKIPVIVEPGPDGPQAKAGRRPAKQVLETIAVRGHRETKAEEPDVELGGFDPRPLVRLKRAIEMESDGLVERAKSLSVRNTKLMPQFLFAPPLPVEQGAPADLMEDHASTKLAAMMMNKKVTDRVQGRIARVTAKEIGGFGGGGFGGGGNGMMGAGPPPAPPQDVLMRTVMEATNTSIRFARPDKGQPDAARPQRKHFNLLPLSRYYLRPAKENGNLQAARAAFLNLLIQIERMPRSGPIYARPAYAPGADVFHDLVAYAPGLNTTAADMASVLDAEAIGGAWNRPGKVDPAARKLLDRARRMGWHALTFAAEAGQPAYTVRFDGTGRFVYERVLPFGLRERVVCDGKTLMYLYPQLALAARRDVSRFHRAELTALVPWFVPPADDLARGADVTLDANGAVVITPQGKDAGKSVVRLIFDQDGQLAERQLREQPAGKLVGRLRLRSDGQVRLDNGTGAAPATRLWKLAPCEAPTLFVDAKDLLVLPLPYRTAEHVRQSLKLEKKGNADVTLKEALPLFLAHVAAGDGTNAQQLFQQVFHAREQRQLGFYVLLAACGVNLDSDHGNVLAEHLDEPLARYLALYSSPVLTKHASQWAAGSGSWQDGFLQHLATTHAILQRWQNAGVLKGDPTRAAAEKRRALAYIRKNHDSLFGWALLCLVQDRADKDAGLYGELAELWPLFAKMPGLAFAAQYEEARSLWSASKKAEARQRFRTLYETAVKDGMLPAVDADLRAAQLADDGWDALMRQTARAFVAAKRRPAVLALARQCWDLGDQPLAGALLTTALDGIAEPDERTALALAAFDFLRETGQMPEADALLQRLLADPQLARQSLLWRLAHEVAGQRDMPARSIECLERALDLEAEAPPAVIDLEAARLDYGALLTHYQGLADAMVALKLAPPADFRSRVIRAADRWRAVDDDPTAACEAAALVFKRLGERELAWDYLTTPVGLRPNESAPWSTLAAHLAKLSEPALADRAYRAATEAEPTNAQLLWDRAQNLKQLGRHQDARQLIRQIAEGSWQPRFGGLQAQAKHLIGN